MKPNMHDYFPNNPDFLNSWLNNDRGESWIRGLQNNGTILKKNSLDGKAFILNISNDYITAAGFQVGRKKDSITIADTIALHTISFGMNEVRSDSIQR